jgi:hypothetical protein
MPSARTARDERPISSRRHHVAAGRRGLLRRAAALAPLRADAVHEIRYEHITAKLTLDGQGRMTKMGRPVRAHGPEIGGCPRLAMGRPLRAHGPGIGGPCPRPGAPTRWCLRILRRLPPVAWRPASQAHPTPRLHTTVDQVVRALRPIQTRRDCFMAFLQRGHNSGSTAQVR